MFAQVSPLLDALRHWRSSLPLDTQLLRGEPASLAHDPELCRACRRFADRPGHPDHDERIREIAVEIAEARDVLYLGRGSAFPLALEGALKLKGNLIHPRRRLCRRRDEARPDRPH